MSSAIHFYLTFNPFLNQHEEPNYTQAHEFYEKLKSEVENDKQNGAMWWGKIIGHERQSDLNIEKHMQILKSNQQNSQTTHLYISDFNNLWVAKVVEVSNILPKGAKTLKFYKDKKVEIWFKITDFDLIEHTPEGTANKLSELYVDNPHSDLKIDGLSPFTTGVRYPVLIQDLAEEAYFDELDEEYSHLILKPHPVINNMAHVQVLKYLNSYSLPDMIYKKIPYAAKSEIELAEIDVLENRHHNNHRIAFSYIKAFEVILNDLVIGHIKRSGFANDFYVAHKTMPPKIYFQPEENTTPLSKFSKNFSINQLVYFIRRGMESNFCLKKTFSQHKPFVDFMTEVLPLALRENKILEIRGILAHGESNEISSHDAMAIRNLMLGIGCKGLIHAAYQSFYHKEFKDMAKVLGNYQSKDGERILRMRKAG